MNFILRVIIKPLLFLLITILSTNFTWSQVSPQERQALIDFYNATDGDNWTNTVNGNKPWLINDPNSPVSDWHGITVQDNKVIQLWIIRNNLSGNIPVALGELINLNVVNLGINRLTGTIPKELGNLVNLTYLSLGTNQLTGSIPEELGALFNLEILFLKENQLSGSIPKQLANLSVLKVLGLSQNRITGTIPRELGGLSNLGSLTLESNQLTGVIPDELGNIVNLENFRVDNNQLTGSVPISFGNLNSLNALYVSSNQMSGKIPSFPNIMLLQFENNKFVFSDWEGDHAVYSSSVNGYRYSPQAKVDQTETLSVTENGTITLSSAALTSINNSYQWYKDGVAIAGATSKDYVIDNASLDAAGVYRFTATNSIVTDLTLERNPITLAVTEDTCGVSAEEKQALIDFYNATDGPNWTNTWDLNTSVCDWYGITVENGNVTRISLTSLGLNGSIPPSIGNLLELEYLYLATNGGLTGTIPVEIGNLNKLSHLFLANCSLSGEIPSELGNLEQLKSLNIRGNNISSSIPPELGNLLRLTHLYIDNNNLSGTIPAELGNLKSLTHLYSNGNNLSGAIPIELSGLSSVKFIFFQNNKLSRVIPKEIINSLSSLEQLSITNNNFVFSDFETEFNAYQTKLGTNFKYTPQAKVDQTETLSVTENGTITLSSTALTSTNNSYQWYKDGVAIAGATSKDYMIDNAALDAAGVYHFTAINSAVTDLTLERNPITLTVNADACGVSAAEKQALIDLYNSTDGANWTNPWDLNEPVCDWYGVTVSAGKVIQLDLNNNNLSGNITESITDITELFLLRLYGNALTGTIPETLYSHDKIKFLNLRDNQLTGAISSTINQMVSLERLDVGKNNLTGTIPKELGTLTLLTDLRLNNNQLTGSIPDELGQLVNLTQAFYLYSNNLNGPIPESLGQLTLIKDLRIGANQLSGAIPQSFENLINLENLLLENNQLEGQIPNFSNILSARFFIEGNNFVFSNFESEHPAYQTNVSTYRFSPQGKVDEPEMLSVTEGGAITLSSTALTSPDNSYQWYKDGVAIAGATDNVYVINTATNSDAGVYHFTATNSIVTNLTLERNPITLTTIPCGVSDQERDALLALYQASNGDNWTNTLANNQPWDINIPVCDWYGVTVENGQVVELSLDDNQLVGTIPDAIIGLQNLTNLDLGNNSLSGVITSSLGSLLQLTSLSLDHNDFTGNIPPTLGSLSNLVTLELGNNTLVGGVPIAICNLTNLEILDLSYNQLSEELVSQLGLLTRLRRLDLSHNEFEGPVPVRTRDLRNLEYLAINDNKLSGNIPVLVTEISSLEEFYFQNNQFIFKDFENQHPNYLAYINTAYSYMPQGKTDAEETKNVTEGNPVTLSTIMSSPNNTYIWYKNGQIIPDEEEREYSIEKAALEDAAQYHVTATNSVITGLTLERHLITLEVKETCAVSESERNALIAIYNATNGANWTNTISGDQVWAIDDTASLVCDWHGVVVENDSVIALNLANNNLTASLPDVFADLPNLRTVVVDHNALEGVLPSSLTTITGLTSLKIDHNNYLFAGLETDFNIHQSKLGTAFSYAPQSDVESLETRVVAQGDPLRLTSTVFTSTNNIYEWFKDGNLIDDANTPNYEVPSATIENVGNYYLEVTNSVVSGLVIKRRQIKVEVNQTGDDCLVSELEKQALIDFYNSTDGANWTNNTNWLTDELVCNWYGVTVQDGKVTNLKLVSNGLQGIIPSSIGNLIHLKELHIRTSQLNGSIPNEIGNLENLEILYLNQANLSGNIPNEILQLKKLLTIQLGNNQLTGTIPEGIGELGELISINLQANDLIGSIPESIMNLKNLKSLYLNNNKLSGTIPSTIGGMISLNALSLESNELSGAIPSTIGQLKNLKTLFLNDNDLTGELPIAISELTEIKDVFIQNNQLSGTIPLNISKQNNLDQFNFFNNNFVFIDFEQEFYDYKSNLRTLNYAPQAKVDQTETLNVNAGQELRLTTSLSSQNNTYQWYKDNTLIEGAINKDFIIASVTTGNAGTYFVRASNDIVSGLTLERNPITVNVSGSADCDIPDEERLALIDFYLSTNGVNWSNTIAGNKVWGIDDLTSSVCDWFGVSVVDGHVVGLELVDNKVKGELPDALLKLKQLKKLDISKNDLVGAIPGWLGYISSLEEINLRENILTGAIPSEVGDLSNLKILDLGDNRLCCRIPETIGNLVSMEYFDVSLNKLEGTIPDSFYGIIPLHTVKIQNNRLQGGISENIQYLQNLEIFWINNNSFSGLVPQNIGQLPKLYSVRLNNNSFRGDLAQIIQNINLPSTDIQIQHNRFVFSDFEPEHPLYRDNIDTYVYSPQARVDRTEYINVEIGGTATLFTEALTSPNNTYRWYKEDGTFVRETTLREFTLTNIQDTDLGGYYFLSTNSTIEGLTLERNRLYLQLPGSDPNNPGIAIQSFCISQDGVVTVSDLNSPILGVPNVTWYEEETGGFALFSDDELIEESKTYWAENANTNDPRVPLLVIMNSGAPGLLDEDYQQFTIVQQATIADLQITGDNITWYDKAVGGNAYALTDTLEDGKNYFAQSGDNACRFGVAVRIRVFIPEGEEWQFFCASQNPTIADLIVTKTHPENTLVWYREETGTTTYDGTEPLDHNKTYYVVQRDNLGNESEERKGITVEIVDIPAPQVTSTNQVFYSDTPVTIAELFAVGQNIVWYDAPYDGTAYSPNEVLVNGETYYGAQSTLNCNEEEGNCCTSIDRVAVTVTILPEEKPTLIGCELFKPQPGARYVINGWVREDGVLPVNPQTISFNTSEASELFVDLLNHLKEKITSDNPLERNLPPVYVPEKESRKYDGLVPFVRKISDQAKNFTVYDFKPKKLLQNGRYTTVGFTFKLDPSSAAPVFTYLTPKIRINIFGIPIGTLITRYPLLNQPTMELEFIGAQMINGQLKLESQFSIVGGSYSMNDVVNDNLNGSILLSTYEKFDFIPNPDYEVMEYANSLLKLKYRDTEGNTIPMSTQDVEFRPQGPIIDGWQQVVGEFRIPTEAANMVLALESRLADGAASNTHVHFDDIRMHPFDGSMKTFVYDPVTQRLKSELDENNFATFYEYDQEGGLIRVKKETERGVYTIQETRSGNSKLNNSGR